MKQILLYCLLFLCVLSSCEDESLCENVNPGEGECNVTFCMSFHPETDVPLGDSRAADGDAIKEIKNLFIILYDQEGKYTGLHHYINNPTIQEVPRDEHCPVDTMPTTERNTAQAKLQCRIPYGVYRIYAVANMGNLAENDEYRALLANEADFKQIRFKWDMDIPKNAQMSGYFTTIDKEYVRDQKGNYERDAKELVIDKNVTSLHAWLRRAASKVTVAYDATKLREGVIIYLKSVTLKNIPASCSLVDENTPQKQEDLIVDGDRIVYEKGKETQSDAAYILAKGHPNIDGHESIHNNGSTAMFFYENMQGIGKENSITDKRQNIGMGNIIAYPDGVNENGEGWRDGKVFGTYVEVEAYYVSNAVGNVGRGRIIYRFMLGKDIITDYNAERNYHYKLTLKFNGNANDVDWHIDYKEEDAPGVYIPDYYVSYLYNQPYIDYNTDDSPNKTSYWEKCYPIRLAGENVGSTVTVRIIENNWYPTGETGDLNTINFYKKAEYLAASEENRNSVMKSLVYTYNGTTTTTAEPWLKSALQRTGIWHGFLSLYPQEGQAQIPADIKDRWGRFSAGEYIYWYGRGHNPKTLGSATDPLTEADETEFGEGIRTYNTTLDDPKQIVGEKVYTDATYGAYKVVKSIRNGIHETAIYIPLYTRPLVINQKKSFSGNNPYFSFQRTAKLQVNAQINGLSIQKTFTVNQVRRIINPKGIFRSWDNTTPFKVTLMYRTSEQVGADFVSFLSEDGPWRATIVAGKGWNINGSDRAEGQTNSEISFTVAPNAKLENSSQTACALVRVEYHNYHCVHYIHLRQGYAPLSLDGGKTYWHSFNVSHTDGSMAYECDTELDAGSMFRYGNLTQPIDGINNEFNDRFTTTAWFNGKFVLAPVGQTERATEQYAAWNEITPQNSFATTIFTVDGVQCRMTKYNDFIYLKETNKDIDFSLGLCYGDEATENSAEDEKAFNYSWYARKGAPGWLTSKHKPDHAGEDPYGASGVRGCFIYDHVTADVIFLSLGACSHGRRKGRLEEGTQSSGILRYGDFDYTFENTMHLDIYRQAPYVPQLHALNEDYGSVYWLSDRVSTAGGTAVAWDINYVGVNINPIYEKNLHTGSSDADAAYIRLVQDTEPTLDQCNKIDARVKAYQK